MDNKPMLGLPRNVYTEKKEPEWPAGSKPPEYVTSASPSDNIEILDQHTLSAQNFFERLQVSKDANKKEIQEAYIRLAQAYYGKSDVFPFIEEAYNALMNPVDRAVVDASRINFEHMKLDIIKDFLQEHSFMSAVSLLQLKLEKIAGMNTILSKKYTVDILEGVILKRLSESVREVQNSPADKDTRRKLTEFKINHLVDCLGMDRARICNFLGY